MKNIVYCNIRIEEDAWEKLKVIAKINKRSLNKEIEYLIDKKIQEYEQENDKIITKKFKDNKETMVLKAYQ